MLTAKLMDAKECASLAKQDNDKAKQKNISKEIRELIVGKVIFYRTFLFVFIMTVDMIVIFKSQEDFVYCTTKG